MIYLLYLIVFAVCVFMCNKCLVYTLIDSFPKKKLMRVVCPREKTWWDLDSIYKHRMIDYLNEQFKVRFFSRCPEKALLSLARGGRNGRLLNIYYRLCAVCSDDHWKFNDI